MFQLTEIEKIGSEASQDMQVRTWRMYIMCYTSDIEKTIVMGFSSVAGFQFQSQIL